MPQAMILSACRTPIGKFNGTLSSVPAVDLGAACVASAVERSGVKPGEVDEVILGNVLAAGAGQAPARQAALRGGLGPEVAALTINKVCGSGLKSVMLAAQAIRCGDARIIVAGGMESMSRAGYLLPRQHAATGPMTAIDTMLFDGLTCAFSGRSMGELAEGTATRADVSRADQDRFALESHRRAIAAIDSAAFAPEIIPVETVVKGARQIISQDEGPRRETSLEALSRLRASFRADGTVTPGNSSMISDGAAAVVVASDDVVRERGLVPLARIVASVTVGGPPEEVFTAPIAAIRRVGEKARMTMKEIDLFELNEAFAAQMLACARELHLPEDRLNVHGGAIALGHPIGASGARVLVTLLGALRQRRLRYGVAALCLGGGNAVAMLVESLPE